MNKDGLIEQLYSRYYGSLMVIACSYTRDKAAAEDLVQNAFLKALLAYKPAGSFLAWANRVIRNDFLNSLRTEKYRADTEAEMLEAADCFDLMENLMHNEKKSAARGDDRGAALASEGDHGGKRLFGTKRCGNRAGARNDCGQCAADPVAREESLNENDGERGGSK